MTSDQTRHLLLNAAVALAAGAASALLFALSARGTPFAMLLTYFAPLPLMIAALGYGLLTGVAAMILGIAGIAVALHPIIAAAFGVALGLPAALLCFVVLYTPPADREHGERVTGRAMFSAVVLSSLTVIAGLVALTARFGGYERAVAEVSRRMLPLVRSVAGEMALPAGLTIDTLTTILIAAVPPAMAASGLLMLTLNLYCAGRIANLSGTLPRAWPDIAKSLALPGFCAALFALAGGLSFLRGSPGVISFVVASALGMAFALQGLAVIHVITRGVSVRFAILFALYMLIFMLPPWPFLPLALLGFADSAFHLRARIKAQPNTP